MTAGLERGAPKPHAESPKQAQRSDATRQALIRAARAEFAEYGLAGARVDRIAEAAGVNKERIYGLFGSKDKLFDVILIETMREFLDVVRPLAQTDPGDYVADLFDYHREHPQLLRLLLWEGLHRGADAHDVDGWRVAHYVRKFDSAQRQFDVDEDVAGRTLLALCGLANWSMAVPQTTRLLLGEAADDPDATREFMREFARAAMQNEVLGPRGAGRRRVVNELTTRGGEPAGRPETTTDRAGAPADGPETATDDVRARPTEYGDTPASAGRTEPVRALGRRQDSLDGGPHGRVANSSDRATLPAGDPDPVDDAARRLREAQAAAEAARAELAEALRDAHARGTSANQLARQVNGTLSRPVVLRLLAD